MNIARHCKSPLILSALLVVLSCSPYAVLAGDKTAADLVNEAREHITEITPQQAKAELDANQGVILLDVRTAEEYAAGHLANAINVPRGVLEFQIDKIAPDKDADIIVYCRSGSRGALATQTLQQMGYTNVRNMAGAYKAWTAEGYPVQTPQGEPQAESSEK